MRKTIISWSLVVIVLALPSGLVLADGKGNLQALLRGDYDFVTIEECVASPEGFSEDDYLIPLGPSNNSASYVMGTMSFDGQGNAVSSSSVMAVNEDPLNNPLGFSIFSGHFECSYTYTVNPDRSFTLVQNECTGVGVKGAPGLRLRITGGVGRGVIGQHIQTIQIAAVEPALQYMTLDETFTIPRYCTYVQTSQRARRDTGHMQ